MEVFHAIHKLKNCKAIRDEYITGDMLKETAEGRGGRKVHELLSLALDFEPCQEEWKCGSIIKFTKKKKSNRLQQLDRINPSYGVREVYDHDHLVMDMLEPRQKVKTREKLCQGRKWPLGPYIRT